MNEITVMEIHEYKNGTYRARLSRFLWADISPQVAGQIISQAQHDANIAIKRPSYPSSVHNQYHFGPNQYGRYLPSETITTFQQENTRLQHNLAQPLPTQRRRGRRMRHTGRQHA